MAYFFSSFVQRKHAYPILKRSSYLPGCTLMRVLQYILHCMVCGYVWRLLVLATLLLPTGLHAQHKKKSSSRNVPDSLTNYRLFEKRDVGAYRARVEFIDPYLTVTPRTPPVPEADTVRRRVPVQVDMAPSMARLLDRHIEENAARTETEGFRIQIFSGASRDMAYKIREDVASMHASHTAYAFYDRPYFKVRVGDLVSRDEADRLCRELRGTYPGAFVVPDVVKIKK